jgi:hypothetical protein
MSEINASLEKMKKKVEKDFPDFVVEIQSCGPDSIKNRLGVYAKELAATIQAQESDEDLERAKNLVSELSGPYNDAKKAIILKVRYLKALSEEKGG